MATAESTRLRPEPRLSARVDPWRLAPVLAAALAGGVYLVTAPKTGDLAAHVFRSELFGRYGFTVWNGDWYGGHHTPAYSVLFPPLAWLVGPAVAGVLGALAAAAAFEPLARCHFGPEARWGSLWFGLATSTMLFTGRLPYALGVAIGLGALLALQRRRTALAVLLAILCPLGSPVAGAFLALAAIAVAIASDRRYRTAALLVAAGGIVPTLLLTAAFPEGGHQPYAAMAFVPVLVSTIFFVILVPREERTLRVGALLYAVAAIVAFIAPTPLGGNASRLGELFAGPVALCALMTVRRDWARPAIMVVLLVPLAFWQLSAPVRAVLNGEDNASRFRVYYRPLVQYLEANEDPPGRVEVVFTDAHWESANVAIHEPIARGWERQLDIGRNSLFYDGTLNAQTYRRWLADNAVRWVALPDTRLDYSGRAEAALVERGLPYLTLRWASPHWRLYEVTSPHSLVTPQGSADVYATSFGAEQVRLVARRPGSALVRVRWTPYWIANGACVQRDGDWTRITTTRPGTYRLRIDFSLWRVFERGRRCG
ncbi:MAG TPA: hypothetical protein VH817_15895 [Thermoleophilaceae bacterium]